MATNSKNTARAVDEAARAFENDWETADGSRSLALGQLLKLRSVKAAVLQREHAQLAKEFGADDPRVAEAYRRVAANDRLVRVLAVEAVRADTVLPAADESGWVLHGYVRDQKLQPQPKLTVALYDPRGRWLEQFGHVCTDERGYFKLAYEGADKASAGTSSGAAEAAAAGTSATIRVLNRQGETIYIDPAPTSFELGQVIYREILLSEKAGSCPPPSTGETPTRPAPRSSRRPTRRGK